MRRLLEYAAYRAIAFVVPLLPRRVAVALGRRLGGLYCLLDARGRRTGMENLRRVFPDRTDHRRLLQRAMRQSGVALIDALCGLAAVALTAALGASFVRARK